MTASSEDVVTQVRPQGGVVVGDDGSAAAEQAVRYGLEEARRRAGALHVVRAWQIPDAARPESVPAGYAPSMPELEEATRAETVRRVQRLLGADVGVPVHVHAVHGAAAAVLVDASQNADVLVVGTRGLSGVASLLLGSVAEECIRNSASPVVVVR